MTKGPLSLPRTLSDLEEGPEYSAFKTNLNPRLHYGQRKLLLTEVAFLTRWGHLAKEVVYVGAAPGTHIPYLAHLFPEHHFVLYDSGDFVFVNYPEARKRITTHQRYFTDQDAKGYEKRDVLFISDIRGGISDEEAALAAAADMELQAGWVETIRPRATMLKFRLPWEAGETEYFAGELRLQPWAPKTTNETRLEFEGVPERKPYSHGEYDRKLHYLNEGLRQWGFFKGRLPPDVPGVDHCFSCALEVVTWEEFLEAGYGNGADVSALMNEATEAVGQRLDLAPHGVDPKIPMVKKRERLIRACEDGVFPCEPQARKKAARRKKFARRRRKTTPPQK